MRTHRFVVGLFFISTTSLTASCGAGSGDGPHATIILADPTPSADCAARCAGLSDRVAGCRTVTLPPGTDPNPYDCTHPSMKIDEACGPSRLVCQASSTRVICGDDHKVHPVNSPEPAYVLCDVFLSIE